MINGKLVTSIFIDIVGYASYLIPVWGEASDLVFFAVEAAWIRYAYKSNKWALFGGAEELLPFTDFLPACTWAHIKLHRKLKKRNVKKTKNTT